jgi:uncharacterized phage protein (TIGR02218 family)
VTVYPEALAAHLERAVTSVCHCWRMTRTDGDITGYTDHDRTLIVDGMAFEPESGFSASEARDTLGLAVDTVDVEGALSSERISEADIAAGLYDGAKVETLLVNWRSPADFVLLRTATIGKITRGDQRFVAELESLTQALDRPGGRYVSRACDAELGDSRCGFLLDQPGFTATGSVVSAQSAETIVVSGLGDFASGWFAHGVVTWITGLRAGRSERVFDHRKQEAEVSLVLMSGVGPLAGGEDFSIAAGCDKTFATCKAKFANSLNFRGFPHLPGNDSAYDYVVDGGNFDGGPLIP